MCLQRQQQNYDKLRISSPPRSADPRIRGARANRVPYLSLFKGSSITQPEKPTHAQRVRSNHVLHTYEGIWAVPPSLLQA